MSPPTHIRWSGIMSGCRPRSIVAWWGGATLGLLALAVLAVTTARRFVWPDTDDPTRTDAIVMFAGGQGERLPVARRLAERGVASTAAIDHDC
jgi:hypothetical protein